MTEQSNNDDRQVENTEEPQEESAAPADVEESADGSESSSEALEEAAGDDDSTGAELDGGGTDSEDEEPLEGATALGTGRIRRPSRRTIAREDRRRRSEARQARKRLYIGIGGGLIAAMLIAGLVLPSLGHIGVDPNANSETAIGTDPSVGTRVPIQSGGVIEVGAAHAPYSSSPPTSGPRYEEPVDWGTYEAQQPDEAVVQNLAQGGIIISHNLIGGPELEDLESFVSAQPGYPGCFVLQPYPTLELGTVAVTSWGWTQEFSEVDRPGMQTFIDDHRNLGIEFVSHTCGADTELPISTEGPGHDG